MAAPLVAIKVEILKDVESWERALSMDEDIRREDLASRP